MKDYELAVWKGKELNFPFYGFMTLAGSEEDYGKLVAGISVLVFLPAAYFFRLYGALLAIVLFAFLWLLPSVIAYSIRERIEKDLVIALYTASRIPSGTPPREILGKLAEYREFGILQDIFSEAHRIYIKGGGRRSMESILLEISKKVGSEKLERAINILILGMSNNRDTCNLLLKSAEDLEDIDSLTEQKKANLATQKYTLLLSSAVLIPFILGVTGKMFRFFDYLKPLLSSAGFGAGTAGAAAIGGAAGVGGAVSIASVENALFIYILIQAVMASFWVAFVVDEKKSYVAFYLPALTLSSLLTYTVSRVLI